MAGSMLKRAASLAAAVLVLGPLALGTVPSVAGTTPVGLVAAAPAPPLRPNLRSLPAKHFYITGSGSDRRLRFESALANTGKGPMEVLPNNRKKCGERERHASQVIYRDVDRNGKFTRAVDTRRTHRSAGCMIFHPTHDHWHFEAAARYALLRASGERLVSRRKVSFCLRDSTTVPERLVANPYPQFYGACSRDARQGISIGWADVYQNYLPGQSLRLPARKGTFCLKTKADVENSLRETDNTDNVSVRAIRIEGNSVERVDRSRCARVA